MIITDVEAIHLCLPEVEEIADGTQDVLVVRIHTDTGLVGIGEVTSQSYVCKAIFEAPHQPKDDTGLPICCGDRIRLKCKGCATGCTITQTVTVAAALLFTPLAEPT